MLDGLNQATFSFPCHLFSDSVGVALQVYDGASDHVKQSPFSLHVDFY